MLAASSLPQHDPERQAVQLEATAAGAETLSQWRSLSANARQVRQTLADVTPPSDLNRRLTQIPGLHPNLPMWKKPLGEVFAELFTLPRAIAAIAVIALALGGYAVWNWWSDPIPRLQFIESQAMALQYQPLASIDAACWAGSDPKAAQNYLNQKLPWTATVLSPKGPNLLGAATVKINGVSVALTRYEQQGHQFTLLEYEPNAYGLPAMFPRHSSSTAANNSTRGVKAESWSEPSAGCGWTVVMDADAPRNPFSYAY
ncbi:MAG: hypothetical protein ABSC42_12095 [Tepidisphaeraceae bacterium]|jgi:ABC-type cobalt transport system substrate-binding protein